MTSQLSLSKVKDAPDLIRTCIVKNIESFQIEIVVAITGVTWDRFREKGPCA